jgi:hypothetical protein
MDPPPAEAHVAIGIMPTFFAENPRQWFQTAEAQVATARPTPNNGQKYLYMLQKLLLLLNRLPPDITGGQGLNGFQNIITITQYFTQLLVRHFFKMANAT